ncbi:MAG: alpha/beta hydrolase [bacterium]|nr:alpha/beta hydrolase [bacterium]
MAPSISSNDRVVGLPEGRLFTRVWLASVSTLTPILLLHDSLGSAELWRDFPEALCAATGRSVIAYDRLGYGRSDAHPGLLADDHIETESETVALLLDQLGVDHFVAFGHSIGAEMAVACGSRLPQRCAAVIAECAQSWIEDKTLRTIAAAREQFNDPEQLEKLRRYHGDKAEWVLDAWHGTWFRPSMREWSILPELPNLRCPLLVLHGADDKFVSLEQPRTMARSGGGPSRLEIIDGCGHIPHRERMDVVLDVVSDFLRDIE